MRYARIIDNNVVDLRDFERTPDPNPSKGLVWRECPSQSKPTFNPETEIIEAPSYTIRENDVLEVWSIRSLTEAELTAKKNLKLNQFEKLSFEVNFEQENRIRFLESKQPISRAQYKNALLAIL